MNKVLIITYYWPPGSGAGVQRWLKFSKYLPSLGWEPVILTVDPEYAAYPAVDFSLENDLPEGIEVHRTKTIDWFRLYNKDKSKVPSAGFAKNKDDSIKGKTFRFIRGNFFIPDPRKGWNRYAFRKACEIINNKGVKHIVTTSPPHSTQLIGLKLKKRYPEIRWFADLRDPWTEIYYYKQFYPTFFSKKIDLHYEKSVLNNCDRIITVGNSLKESFSKKVKGIENKIEIITNGFDESDFEGKPAIVPSRFTITYVGTLSEAYPVDGLIRVLANIQKRDIDFLFRLVGLVAEANKKKICSEIRADSIEFIPYSIHSEAISYLLNSSILLLVIPDHINNKSIITGKIFEYIASKKPILCLGPVDGDAAKIIFNNDFGRCFSYFDESEIENFILSALSGRVAMPKTTEEFSHKNLAKKLVSCLQ
jgi:glycosyltransferase involved in cell wall biosynthesis